MPIETPGERFILFDGLDDALFIVNHPLAGATFTWEAVRTSSVTATVAHV